MKNSSRRSDLPPKQTPLFGVKPGKAQNEQMFSGLPPKADVGEQRGHFRLVPRTDIRVIVRLRSRLENQASSRVRAYELRRHHSARGFVKSFARTMQRNHVSRIDFLECPDRISNVVLLIGREMKAPDHRMNSFHTRGDLSLPDRVDHAAMT